MQVIISGASTTSSPWPTWSDVIKDRYRANWLDVSQKGMGNEAIILRALRAAFENKNANTEIMIIIMLTNVDKWDWYVNSDLLLNKFNKEKHTITKLHPTDKGGFWCTGSWFPLDKETFKDKYYNQDYFTLKSLQLISVFRDICIHHGWKYHIMYDSPIWSMTEQELNLGSYINTDNRLITSELCNWLYQSIKLNLEVYELGLIGYLHSHSIPWFSKRFGPHPGPLAHLAFTKEFIYPLLDQHLTIIQSNEYIDQKITRMNDLWTL